MKEVASQWQRNDLWVDQESSQQFYIQMETSKKKLMMKLPLHPNGNIKKEADDEAPFTSKWKHQKRS
jgi:hypothetical protein